MGRQAYKDYEWGTNNIKPINPFLINSAESAEWDRGWKDESDSHDWSLRKEQYNRHEGRYTSF